MSDVVIETPMHGSSVDAIIVNGHKFDMHGLYRFELIVDANSMTYLKFKHYPQEEILELGARSK